MTKKDALAKALEIIAEAQKKAEGNPETSRKLARIKAAALGEPMPEETAIPSPITPGKTPEETRAIGKLTEMAFTDDALAKSAEAMGKLAMKLTERIKGGEELDYRAVFISGLTKDGTVHNDVIGAPVDLVSQMFLKEGSAILMAIVQNFREKFPSLDRVVSVYPLPKPEGKDFHVFITGGSGEDTYTASTIVKAAAFEKEGAKAWGGVIPAMTRVHDGEILTIQVL